jgi:hypothetical protein
MKLKEILRDIIREEITKVINDGHQSVELKDVDPKQYIGKTVYHGINSRLVRFIINKGLQPRTDRYEYKYKDPDMSDEEIKQLAKTLPKELYVALDERTAMLFAKEGIRYIAGGSGPMFRVTKEIVPIVVSFKLKASDKISKVSIMQNLVDRGFDVDPTEIVLNSPISVDRLTIVSPKGAKWSDFYKEKTELASSTRDTVKQINTILKPYKLAIKAKSKSTDQAGGVYLDSADRYEPDWALRLSDVAMYLKGAPVKSPFNYMTDEDMQKNFDTFFDRISTADKKKIINIVK